MFELPRPPDHHLCIFYTYEDHKKEWLGRRQRKRMRYYCWFMNMPIKVSLARNPPVLSSLNLIWDQCWSRLKKRCTDVDFKEIRNKQEGSNVEVMDSMENDCFQLVRNRKKKEMLRNEISVGVVGERLSLRMKVVIGQKGAYVPEIKGYYVHPYLALNFEVCILKSGKVLKVSLGLSWEYCSKAVS
uniref:Ribonuclease D, Exosome-associated factor Rrp6 n=1 Tax=Tanacetum cinerariifolium TaxID=118510 RepID=A0A699HSQ4_TANCI|nr:ribonuclease D, Exosome-associated factor Rrp6 [Tanacetum cinerariifolium]